MAVEVGSVVEGTVTGVTKFGAFVRLPDGQTGLVHISEIADEYVSDIRTFVAENQAVQVRVLSLNDKGKYDLSIKQVTSGSPTPPRKPKPRRGPSEKEPAGFEDMLSKWKRESEERLLDVKRNTEAKRGGRGGGKGRP